MMKEEKAAQAAVPISEMSYETAVAELEVIVRKLENGDSKLEESAALYERGVALSKHCAGLLRKVEEKISKLKLDDEGVLREEPLEV